MKNSKSTYKIIMLLITLVCGCTLCTGCGEKKATLYEQLFDINNKIEIDIDITEDQLALLQEDYEKYSAKGSKSPIYRETSMTITIHTSEGADTYEFENVGIRMKGNTSRTDFYNPEDGKYNLIHFKIAFPEEFAGLEKLDMRWNKMDDSTYIREYYSYEFMRDCGLLAPHSNLASVNVAGIHEGVFSICEPIDKLFIEKNLPEEDWDGDLYKCGWTWSGAKYTADMSVGIEDEEKGKFYNFDLKNNKKTSNHESMNNLLEKLNDGDVTKEELAQLVDMDYFVKFAAASFFIGNPDDMRYDYNNHYIYFLKSSNKAIFIPCDNDRSFGLTKDWNPTGDAMVSVHPFSTLADATGEEQKNPLFIYTVDAGGYYVEEYVSALKEVAGSEWLIPEKFDSIYNIAYDHYKEDATPDKRFYNAWDHKFCFDNQWSAGLGSTDSNASFEEYIEAKMNYFNECMADYEIYGDDIEVPGVSDKGEGYSLRGTFNDWAWQESYVMDYDKDSNTYSYKLSLNSAHWLKIASDDDTEWYGYENIVGDIDSSRITYDTGHYNIILDPGTYLILFDADRREIEIIVE